MELIPYLTLARLALPLLMYKYRLLGFAIALLADMVDWLFLEIQISSKEYDLYQNWDKILDLYMFTLATLFIVRKLKDKYAKKIGYTFFVTRAAADIILFITGFQAVLLFIPNFLETFLVFFLAYQLLTKRETLFRSWKHVLFVIGVIAITKVSHEYMLHVLYMQPWDLFDLGNLLNMTGIVREYFNYVVVGGIMLHAPSLLLLLFYVKKYRGLKFQPN